MKEKSNLCLLMSEISEISYVACCQARENILLTPLTPRIPQSRLGWKQMSTPNKPKPNSNPFLVTSNQTYGLSLVGLQEMAAKQQEGAPRQEPTLRDNKQHDLSFLLRRESDRIGEGIPNSDSALAAIMSTRMPKRHTIGHTSTSTSSRGGTVSSTQPASSAEEPSREEIEQALASYRHNPKQEDPLYTTTANEIGRKAPSYATYTVATKGRSQAFSNSFNGVMYTDESLAT